MQYVSYSTKSVLSMKQMLSSSIKILASDCTKSCLRAWKYQNISGGMPPDPPREYLIKRNHKYCPPPTFHDLPTPLWTDYLMGGGGGAVAPFHPPPPPNETLPGAVV